ncbi:hypothetical protein DVA67_013075 [Solirubrobacter sp. CPCC 204708]|uniref:2TM domain-containing protein n=1 Tax=Solirubrobacter deserti TaxID=2282478 RepID=A0ABT4RMG8_9ACTN|nr:hypothetical protein [Solirubrobacter deserti]MBE2316908.1 hypothetical protein [Solirubrobacter deserti]MDA0139739.1 hypothetical protein [Solirubrobacter deserti]
MADKKDKKDKAKKGEEAKAEALVSLSQHPRAKAGIRRARTRAALIAFVLVFVLNVVGDQELFDAVWRALVAGIVVNIVVWRCAIMVWRHILMHELEQVAEHRREQMRAHQERMEKLAADQAEQAAS